MEMETARTAAPALTPEIARGERCIIRPVLEADLPALARLISEAPMGLDWSLKPWTEQRLRKEFESEKEPGLWGRNCRWFTVTDFDKSVHGVMLEEQQRDGKAELLFHTELALPERGRFAMDMLTAYIDYKRNWHNTPRITTFLLDLQRDEQGWLEELGFSLQMRARESWFYIGEKRDMLVYAWIPEWVMAARAPEGIGV